MKKILSLFVFSLAILPAAVLAVDYGGPYTEPTCTPPACNVAAPINVGSSPQTKAGNLTVQNLIAQLGVNGPGVSPTRVLVLGDIVKVLAGIFTPGLTVNEFLNYPAKTSSGVPTAINNGVLTTDNSGTGKLIWTSLGDLCQSTGACSGGSGLPNGSSWQTLFWNGTAWKPSSSLINHDQTGNQFVQASNLVTYGYGTFINAASTDQAGWIKASGTGLDIYGVNTAGGARIVHVNNTLAVDNTTQTNDIIIKNGAGQGKVLVSSINGTGIWTDPSAIFSGGLANGSTDGQVLRWNNSSKKWEPNSTLLLNNNGTTMQVSGNTRFGLSTAPVTLQTYKFQFSDPSAAAGKVLQATDSSGNAVWADVVSGGNDQNWERVSGAGAIYSKNLTDKVVIGDRTAGAYPNGAVAKLTVARDPSENIAADVILAQKNPTTPQGNSALVNFVESTSNSNPNYWSIGKRTSGNSPTLPNSLEMFYNGNSPTLSLTTNNRVGVANTNPKVSLDVTGGVRSSAGLTVGGNSILQGYLHVGPWGTSDAAEPAGNLRLTNGSTDGARLIWRGGAGGTDEFRARLGSSGGLGFFPAKNGTETAGQVETLVLYKNGLVDVPGILATKDFRVKPTLGDAPNTGANQTVLVANDIYGNAVWKKLSDLCTGNSCGSTAYTAGSGIGIAGGVISNTRALQLSGNQLTLSNGGGTVTLPTGTTYTAGTGISVSGGVITNTAPNINQKLSLSGNTLTLDNGGGSVALPTGLPTGTSDQTLRYNNGAWEANSFFKVNDAGGATLVGQLNANKLAANSLQITGGAGTAGQVLTSTDGLGSATWKPLPASLPTNASANDTLRYDGNAWVKNSGLTSDGSVVSVGPIVPSSATEKLRVTGGLRTDGLVVQAAKGIIQLLLTSDTQGTNLGGQTLMTDDSGNASWHRMIRTAMFDNVSINKSGSKNLITYDVIEDNSPNTRDFAIMHCPANYTAIGGGAVCSYGHNLSANGPGDTEKDWRISCGDELGFIQRIKISCAYGVQEGN